MVNIRSQLQECTACQADHFFLTQRGSWPPHSWGFLITHNDTPQLVGLLWTSDQLVAETSTWQHTSHTQQTNIRAPGGIRTHDLSRRAAADLRLRPRGHWDRPGRPVMRCNFRKIKSISLKYTQQDATFSRYVYFYKLPYMFQAVFPPIIRSTKLYIQRQVLSNQYCFLLLSWMRSSISYTVAAVLVWQCLTPYMQFCAPDDGRRNRLKLVEQFIEINRSRKCCILLVVLQWYTCDVRTCELQIFKSIH